MAQRQGRGGDRGSGAPAGSRGADRGRGGGPRGADRARGGVRGEDGQRANGTPKAGAAPNSGAAQRARLHELIDPVVTAAGYDLEGLSLSRAGRRHLVRLTVDRDGGVNLDAVADVSRLVSAALDAVEEGGEELFAGEYELQVSSPGVDRPLTLPRHWRRNLGRLVQVRTGDRQLTGRIVEVGGEEIGGAVVLDVAGTRHRLPFDALGPGRIQLEFTRLAAMSDADLEDTLDPIDDDGDTDDGLTGDGDDHGWPDGDAAGDAMTDAGTGADDDDDDDEEDDEE